jgi:DNA-binding NtrC family response regulator
VLIRPVDNVALRRVVTRSATPKARPAGAGRSALPPLVVGASTEMREVWRLAMQASQSTSSVVITGETGVGKEVVARALHRFSDRRGGPFVAVNCAALPETLLESELFGHEKGAFTGASARRKGRFELADGGTLFLDEIGDLPLSVQVSLLRVLQERLFERLGGTESISVDVRVIAATHRDLDDDVKTGRFRADLFYRLNVLSIRVPPLRERRPDVPGLWEYFVAEGAKREGRAVPGTSPLAVRLLLRHDWPGNVRELHNVAQHALAVTTDATIVPSSLPPQILDAPAVAGPKLGLAGMTFKEIERAAILESYETFGTVKATAEALGISERKIHYRLKSYREEPSPEQAGASQTGVRVLLAEDDDELRWALTEFLQAEGYEVVSVRDGRSLLEQLGATLLLEDPSASADVIVSDIRMPGLTGMQVLERVRAHGWKTPVVLISAFGDEETRRAAQELGASAFVAKPIDAATFHMVIVGVVTPEQK